METSTDHIDMDWTEVVPGLEILVQGFYHNTTVISATRDPLVFRLAGLSLFHGTIGIRGDVPGLGSLSVVLDATISEIRADGTFTVDAIGFLVPVDMVLSIRSVGTITITFGGETFVEEVNGLLVVQVRGGEVFWARAGVPMGWPFQLPFP